MAKLTTLKPRIATLDTRRVKPLVVADRRIVGTTLQNRRFKAWKANPHCAACGEFVQYPDGFELDHIVPLYKGGPDEAENCQILCKYVDTDGVKHGCHADKTKEDLLQE